MFEKIREKSDNLDERIDYIGNIIAQHAGIEAYGNPTSPGQASIWAYGRICSDASDQSHLNDASVVLQTSRDLGMGRRVRLNLNKVVAYSLFPGQVIAVKGSNQTGNVFHVEEIQLVNAMKQS
jgi:DNA polymerase alpha subunit B